jgi:hypothetical protein
MTDHDDPVDAVILAFLDHLEGGAPRPALDHLTDSDRRRAETFLDSLIAGRGLDPYASRPSVEALLADTPLAGLLAGPSKPPPFCSVNPPGAGGADATTVQRVLAGVDGRARVEVEPDGTVVYSYLDLRARFLLVPATNPVITRNVRAVVEGFFGADPDTSRVGVVAARSDELVTQLLSADEVGQTITTPRGEPHTRWDPPLPLALVARRMLEQSAPEWPSFDFDQALGEALDVAAVAAEIAGRVIRHEAARSYRGDKRQAYRALVGRERAFAELVARVSAQGPVVDLDAEATRITQAAA